MDYTESSDMDYSDLFFKEKCLGLNWMPPLPSAERANRNLGAFEEDRNQRINDIKAYLMEGMRHVDSTIRSSAVHEQRRYSRRQESSLCDDDGKELYKSETHKMVGTVQVQKETHTFKTSDCNDLFINDDVYRKNKVTGAKKLNYRFEICRKIFTKYLLSF
ncbi:hypothetical protein NPIL_503111 [Nephila pilipes]|uniref:Uncharacterized protein n=1 Tax=Nephila pilipes TaxID=299642 RepID=A0A8X6TW86_NEPPI|nr:hypothetical protein NPIL_503111 [Nephila pilipes]